MLIEQTLEKLHAMKLGALAEAVQHQCHSDEAATLSFEERLGLLVDAEWTAREQRTLQRRLRTAKLRYPATLEAIDFTHPRRLNRQQVLTLGSGAWIAERHNLLITGPTGIGKSFLACAFVERVCRRGFTARYVRMPRLLLHEVAVGRGDGSYARLLARLAKLDLLAIDDWLLAPLRDAERRDLTEVIEDRAERASTLIACQLPVTDWHGVIGDPNQADAICDRLLHDTHRIELKGPRCDARRPPQRHQRRPRHDQSRGYDGGAHRSGDGEIVAPAASSSGGSWPRAYGSCQRHGKRGRTTGTGCGIEVRVSHTALDGARAAHRLHRPSSSAFTNTTMRVAYPRPVTTEMEGD